MQKILRGEFIIPRHVVSADACDLLSAMMKVPVNERITLEQIKAHRWFSKDLDERFEEQWNCTRTRETTPEVILTRVNASRKNVHPLHEVLKYLTRFVSLPSLHCFCCTFDRGVFVVKH